MFKLKVLPHEEVIAKSVKQKFKAIFKKRGVFWVAIKDLVSPSLLAVHSCELNPSNQDASSLDFPGGCGALGNQFVKEGKDVYVQVNPAFVQGPCDLKCLGCNSF